MSVTYVFQGTVAEVTRAGTDPDDTGSPVEDGIVVDVKQGNKATKG